MEAAVLTDGSSFTEVPVCQRLLVFFLTFSVLPSQFTKRVRAGNGDLNNASHAIIFAVGNAFDDKRMLIARAVCVLPNIPSHIDNGFHNRGTVLFSGLLSSSTSSTMRSHERKKKNDGDHRNAVFHSRII